MWIASVRDNEVEEIYEVLILDNSELSELLDYIKMNPNLDIANLEERFLIGDVKSFKSIINGENND